MVKQAEVEPFLTNRKSLHLPTKGDFRKTEKRKGLIKYISISEQLMVLLQILFFVCRRTLLLSCNFIFKNGFGTITISESFILAIS